MMTVSDFTAYLGKSVTFAVKIFLYYDLFYLVSGQVEAVLIFENLADCQFLVNDVFYSFSDVQFFQNLSNPLAG